jgi:two-component system nitrate/nitrite response regulator NarL
MTEPDEGYRAIQVAVVAPAMLAWGLERMLHAAHPRFMLAGSADSLAHAQQFLQRSKVDIVVLDIDGGYDNESVEEMRTWTQAHLVALTSSSEQAVLDQVVLSGVRGVVRKSEAPAALLKALEKVHEGELWIDRGAAGRIFMELVRPKARRDSDPEMLKIATLTARERQTVLAMASDAGAPGKVIADRLCISEHTLRNHLSAIYGKLGVVNRVDLYAYATRHHLDKIG